ncbi:ABC transporter permease [Tunicatimonas pelagia]|uniref:ABC transporter permease n=1 Tax=Tunicatimonas pelagia TaxID=931531 RepID=UPI002665B533|nr:ABC transporter permease [Tunicatimonas pelagia]WKN43708.1 ABC transporter permease [Tunicatimonas pelagia]
MNSNPSPPKLLLRFFRWFCHPDLHKYIEGDLLELYKEWVKEKGRRTANIKFAWDVLLLFRPGIIKPLKRDQPLNHTAMLQHNLLLTFRNFRRYKSTFFINLIGLSSGLACALLIFLWVQDELNVDKFHAKDDRLYQVMEKQRGDEGIYTSFQTRGPVADLLREEMPQIEYVAAVGPVSWADHGRLALSVGEKAVLAAGQYVGKDYFNIFSYELLIGSKDQVLADKNSIVLSEELATRLFDSAQEAVGKSVEFQQEREFIVSGIFKGTPARSSVQFDFALSFEALKDEKPWVDEWGSSGPLVFAILREGADVEQFNNELESLLKEKFGHDINRTILLQRYSDNYLYGSYENGVRVGGRIEYVRLFSVVAIIILLIASINFVNLATARASRRLKEIGIKKVVGSGRKNLIFQYIGESVLISFFSLAVAILLVALALPAFNEITGKQFTLGFDGPLILSALIITFATGVVAGLYPALYLSGFKPITILKGKLTPSSEGAWARKGLVIFQFTLSIILMVSVWVVNRQIAFVQNQHLGYDKDNVVYFPITGRLKGNEETFLTEMKKIPGVLNASSTGHRIVGHNWSVGSISWAGKSQDDETQFQVVTANYNLLETLGIEVKQGRSFSQTFGAETTKIIFNETAIEAMGLSSPIGSTVEFFGEKEIIGVVNDFHFESLHEEIKPLCFVIQPNSENRIMAKLQSGREKETLAELQNLYSSYNPGFVLDYRFLNDNYQALYEAEQRVSTLSEYFAGIAILISCLGLFGLATFTAERRVKEIGIRKVLGSSDFGIVRLLSGDFTKMVLVAIVIALPISYVIARQWLQDFAFSIELEWWYFAGAGLVALLIAWLSVGFQTIKAAQMNPVDSLRNE